MFKITIGKIYPTDCSLFLFNPNGEKKVANIGSPVWEMLGFHFDIGNPKAIDGAITQKRLATIWNMPDRDW
jgi:hypothetical protein